MDTIRKLYIPDNPPAVKAEDVFHYLGYKSGMPDEGTVALIKSCIEQLEKAMNPKSVYAAFPLKRAGGGIELENCRLRLIGSDIAEHLKDCGAAVLFAATLSPQVDRLIRQTQSKDIAAGLIMDSCASAAIELFCDMVEKEIKSQFEECFFTTRYSPGYGDFPLEAQRDFLSALDAQRAIGLYANDAFLLTPMKSVTAVIGVGNKPPQGSKTGCEFCRIKDNCWFRKRGLYCGVSKSAE